MRFAIKNYYFIFIMNIYLIKNNDNVFGIYNDLDLALDYIYSLVNSNLIQKSDNIIIYEYKINSSVILKEYYVDLKYNISNKITINYHNKNENIFIKPNDILNKYETDSLSESSNKKDTKYTSSIDTEEEERIKKNEREFIQKQNILGQEKINVVHNINLLKEKLKNKEETQNQYNYDLKLYYKFKTFKNNDPTFIIEEKYNVFHLLDHNNKLSFDNFMEKYKPIKISTTYDGMFEENNYTISDTVNSIISDTVNSTISEVFSNVNDNDLYLATNQFNNNEEEVDTITSSVTNSSN